MKKKRLHTNPTSYSVDNNLPVPCVTYDNLSALGVVIGNSHFHDIFWAFDPKSFVDFIFNWKAMCVPSKAPLNMKTILMSISGDNILDSSS
jgi:hypothetical protein